MKRLILIIALIISIPTICFCQNDGWIKVSKSPNGSEAFIKKSEITRSGDYLRAWTKLIHKGKDKADYIAKGIKYANREDIPKWMNYDHELQLIEYDCNNDQSRLLQWIDYSKDGSIIENIKIKTPEWQTKIPETNGEYLFNEVCGTH